MFERPLTLRDGNWGPEKGEPRFFRDPWGLERRILRG